MKITDDGVGFDTSKTVHGSGLLSMKERAESIKGKLTISSAPGAGTCFFFKYTGSP